MQTQQQQDAERRQRREEYQQTQRIAVETVHIGRATAETVQQQGEQLQRAENIADDTQYKLDKATRLLKGMTWSGWVANMFTKDVEAPDLQKQLIAGGDKALSAEKYEALPDACREAAQAILNYHANIQVLVECETEEQKVTCQQICENMFPAAQQQVQKLSQDKSYEAYALQLKEDLDNLRQKQLASQAQVRGLGVVAGPPVTTATADANSDNPKHERQKEELFGRKPASTPAQNNPSPTKQSPKKSVQELEQDEHLQVISASLGELGHIAHSLKTGLHQQQTTIDSLDTKSDNVLETSKMVGRRTDRLIQKKSWTPVKSVYEHDVSIRHVDTGKYLAILQNDVYLINNFNKETCVFELHKRQGKIFGLRNMGNRKWMGQSMLTGTLTCSASSFGRREEWESDEDWKSSRLLCASAGWGQGGYLQVQPEKFAVAIGGSTVPESKSAAQWCLTNLGGVTDNDK